MSSISLANVDLRYKDVYDTYLEQGWQPIPLPYCKKMAPPTGITGKVGIFNRDKIVNPQTGWLQDPKWANGNAAIRAFGILGVDLDAYANKHGDVQMDEIEADLGVALPPTYYSTSRGPVGGRQQSSIRYYRVPTNLHFIGQAATDIELVQETYRFAVVWPSIHPTSGDQYKWYSPEHQETNVPNVNDLPELPQAFIDAWVDHSPRSKSFVGLEADYSKIDMDAFTKNLTDGEPSQYILDAMPDGWEQGRFSTLNQSLWHIARIAIFNPEEPGIGTILQSVWDSRVNATSASTPKDERVNHMKRSLQRAVAAWQAEREIISPEALDWAKNVRAEVLAAEKSAKEEYDALPTTDEDGKAKPKQPVVKYLDTSIADNRLSESAADLLANLICMTEELGWLRWTGKIWSPCPEATAFDLVRKFIITRYDALKAEFAGDEKKMKDIAVLQSASKISAVFKLWKGQMIVDPLTFDIEYDLLNVQNGVVDLKTKTLMPHHPKYKFTKITKAAYISGATHADWDTAQEALDPDSLNWLQWKFGQGITGHSADDDIVPILEGNGKNGKSAIITPVMKAVGTFSTAVPDIVLLPSKNNSQMEITMLHGVRIGVIEELPEGHRLDTRRLKQVVGTEEITGRQIYKPPMTWTPTHSMFITTNYTPIITETDYGSWRRVRKIQFPFTYVNTAAEIEDPAIQKVGVANLRQRLKTGLDGQHEAVLAWLVEGAHKWYQNDQVLIDPPTNIQDAWRKWRGESDHLFLYLEENIEFDEEGMIESTEFLEHFNKWMKRRNHVAWGTELMSNRMGTNEEVTKRKITKKRTRDLKKLSHYAKTWATPDEPMAGQVYAWKGVRFKDELAQTSVASLPIEMRVDF